MAREVVETGGDDAQVVSSPVGVTWESIQGPSWVYPSSGRRKRPRHTYDDLPFRTPQ